MRYQYAEEALSALSTGRPLGRHLAIVAALELRPHAEKAGASPAMCEAYNCLQCIATGGEPVLDLAGRRRAAQLADITRAYRRKRERLLALMEPDEVETMLSTQSAQFLPAELPGPAALPSATETRDMLRSSNTLLRLWRALLVAGRGMYKTKLVDDRRFFRQVTIRAQPRGPSDATER